MPLHYHIKTPSDDGLRAQCVTPVGEGRYRCYDVYQESFPSFAWALARCAVIASVEGHIMFYPLTCKGDYCNGKLSYGPISTALADPGNALRPAEG